MKLLIELIDKRLIQPDQNIWGYLIGTQFSLGVSKDYPLTWIKGFCQKAKRFNQVIVANFGQIIHQLDLPKVKELIDFYLQQGVSYIWYTDLAIYQILKQLNLESIGIYQASTYLTNYYDLNQFKTSLVMSSDISYQELITNLNQLNQPVWLTGFTCSIISFSKRMLVSNFYQQYQLKKRYRNLTIKEEFRDQKYPIIEKTEGTYIYDHSYYYLSEELLSLINVTSNNMVLGLVIMLPFINYQTAQKIIDYYLTIIKTKQIGSLDIQLPLTKGLLYQTSRLEKVKNDE